MKKRILITISLLVTLMVSNQLFSQCAGDKHNCSTKSKDHSTKSETKKVGNYSFNVSGKCDMCKTRIEKAALGVKGVKAASWDKEAKILYLDLKDASVLDEVQKTVANVGYDTEKYKAGEKTYNGLPNCCKYR